MPWIDACATDDIEPEDLRRWDHDGRTFAIYRSPDGAFYCTDGLCTHGRAHLAGGLVIGAHVACPKHNGEFDYRTGKAVRLPACVDLAVHPVRVEGGRVLVELATEPAP